MPPIAIDRRALQRSRAGSRPAICLLLGLTGFALGLVICPAARTSSADDSTLADRAADVAPPPSPSAATSQPAGRSDSAILTPPADARLLFANAFDRSEIGGAWELPKDSFVIKEKALVGGMREGGHHPAIVKISKDFHDIVLKFSFRFDGSPGFSVVFNDIHEPTVHSGHVARISLSRQALTFSDDKSGLMSLQWVDKKTDPKFKEQIDRVRSATTKRIAHPFDLARWYTVVWEVRGEHTRVAVDGKLLGEYSGPGFGQPNETSFHFSVMGRDLSITDVSAWVPAAAEGSAAERSQPTNRQ